MSFIEIQAQPSPVKLDLARTALIIIDMQKDFLMEGGFGAQLGNDVAHLRRTIAPIQRVLAAARELGMVIIHTREGHLPDLSDCPPTKLDRWPAGTRIGDVGPMGRILIRGEEGHDLIEEVYPLLSADAAASAQFIPRRQSREGLAQRREYLLDKAGKNAFYGTDLELILQTHAITHLLVTGVTTDVCCFATTIAANDRGYHALVLADCVASYSPERHAAALAIIQAQGGIFGYVTESAAVLAALAQLAR